MKKLPEAAPTTPDPIEIAMEAEAGDASPDSPARRLLIDQGRLVRWQIASERAGFALKVLIGVAGVAVAGALVAMAWQASRSDGLVVEAFSVSPALVSRGSTGEVVARGVLDRLGELDRAANSLQSVRIADAWTQDTKIEVAQTGVSLDDLQVDEARQQHPECEQHRNPGHADAQLEVVQLALVVLEFRKPHHLDRPGFIDFHGTTLGRQQQEAHDGPEHCADQRPDEPGPSGKSAP